MRCSARCWGCRGRLRELGCWGMWCAEIWWGWKECLEQVFHPLPASVYMDGVGFCFLAQTLHPVEACYRINGLKKLVLAHFSIAQKFIPNAMEWKMLLFWGDSIAESLFLAPQVKKVKWIPSTRKIAQRGWNNKPERSLESRGIPSWQKLSMRWWCVQPKAVGKVSII